MAEECPFCEGQQGEYPNLGNCGLLMAAYILAGLAMMLNIRLSYSSAPYALIRFQLPENLFSVFVRRMASALELWCLPSMLLGNIIDLLQKLVEGGHQVRALIEKAGEIQTKAGTLSSTATSQASGVGGVNTVASSLAANAQALNTAATQLPTADGLTELQEQATALATAAKGSDGGEDKDSLHHHAGELQSDQTNVDKAIAVIDAFKKVAEAYEKLSKQTTYQSNKPTAEEAKQPSSLPPAKEKVNKVEEAWEGVNTQFGTLCKALFKYYADQINTRATSITNVDTARAFKEKYDQFGKIYDSIPDDTADKSTVQNQWTELKNVIIGEMKLWKFYWIIGPSIATQWLNFLTYYTNMLWGNLMEIGLKSYYLHEGYKKWNDGKYKPLKGGNLYKSTDSSAITDEDLIPAREDKFKVIIVPSIVSQWLNFLTYANQLFTDATSLETALSGAENAKAKAQALVTALKQAASNTSPKGLKDLLDELSGLTGFTQIFAQAQKVQQQYETVEREYNNVKNDGKAKAESKFKDVTNAFEALQTEYTNAVSPDKFNWIIGLKTYYKIQNYEKDKGANGENLKDTSGDFKTPRLAKLYTIIVPSIIAQWFNFLNYVILLFVYRGGGDTGR
ncbi:Tpr-related protein family member, putative [Theileria annulata]|uniref:Tpr-related protein family member, putative n=1 Tax=Theileria annulata TaxID=5874 RepID=Q4UF92_THEAN|nr:Tpr-related protein family member, putative [Theileria annulata]CAI74247.1 Tpr-related protein family member, putative [Theileria annulata]|eukprot:XP_951979.1 Tpr-related protein family member, putative [Theileria annulata]